MLKWIAKTKRILLSRGGETLVECIASILIFALAMAAVSVMVATALRITSSTREKGNGIQYAVGLIKTGDFAGANVGGATVEDKTITFTPVVPSGGAAIPPKAQDVVVTKEQPAIPEDSLDYFGPSEKQHFIAFAPPEVP